MQHNLEIHSPMFPEEFSPLETMLGLWVHGWVKRGRILWVLYLLSRAQNPRQGGIICGHRKIQTQQPAKPREDRSQINLGRPKDDSAV